MGECAGEDPQECPFAKIQAPPCGANHEPDRKSGESRGEFGAPRYQATKELAAAAEEVHLLLGEHKNEVRQRRKS